MDGILFQVELHYFSNEYPTFFNTVADIIDVRFSRQSLALYFFIKFNICSAVIIRNFDYPDFIFP